MKEEKKSKKDRSEELEVKGEKKSGRTGALIAKKDFTIHHNAYLRVIKAGDDLSDVPEAYHENLRTEGVL